MKVVAGEVEDEGRIDPVYERRKSGMHPARDFHVMLRVHPPSGERMERIPS
ncbi:MAG: hypothetical protein ABIP63_04010 [Thermoanaerobaculia bacterium]